MPHITILLQPLGKFVTLSVLRKFTVGCGEVRSVSVTCT